MARRGAKIDWCPAWQILLSDALEAQVRESLYAASIACVQRIAAELGRAPTVPEYREMRDGSACHPSTLYLHGGWVAFLRDAGLRPAYQSGPKHKPCACGQPVEHKVVVPCGSGRVELRLCADCYQLEVGE